MDRVNLVMFGCDRDALLAYTDAIEDVLRQKSAEYDGPATFPVFKLKGPIDDIEPADWGEDTLEWIQSLEIDETDLSRLASFDEIKDAKNIALFGRQLRVYNSDAVHAAMELELPESICLHVEVDTVNSSIGGEHSPYTYDPGRDHVTDVDFEAHQS